MSDPIDPARCAELLAALAAPERLNIVRFLADGPKTVSAIAERLGIPAVNLSHHLAVLKSAEFIIGTKRGRFVDYALRPGVLRAAVAAGVPESQLDLGCCRLEIAIDRQTAC